jgi:hypothetical protein
MTARGAYQWWWSQWGRLNLSLLRGLAVIALLSLGALALLRVGPSDLLIVGLCPSAVTLIIAQVVLLAGVPWWEAQFDPGRTEALLERTSRQVVVGMLLFADVCAASLVLFCVAMSGDH